jgi:hypothetical protein
MGENVDDNRTHPFHSISVLLELQPAARRRVLRQDDRHLRGQARHQAVLLIQVSGFPSIFLPAESYFPQNFYLRKTIFQKKIIRILIFRRIFHRISRENNFFNSSENDHSSTLLRVKISAYFFRGIRHGKNERKIVSWSQSYDLELQRHE